MRPTSKLSSLRAASKYLEARSIHRPGFDKGIKPRRRKFWLPNLQPLFLACSQGTDSPSYLNTGIFSEYTWSNSDRTHTRLNPLHYTDRFYLRSHLSTCLSRGSPLYHSRLRTPGMLFQPEALLALYDPRLGRGVSHFNAKIPKEWTKKRCGNPTVR
jgi:hypothetical protein